MAWLQVYMFTKQQRFKLGILFSIFNIVQVFLGAVTTGWSVYLIMVISPNIEPVQMEVDFVFTVYGMYGMYIVLHYLVGMKVCEKCIYKAHKKSTKRHLLFWCLVGCNTILNIVILSVMSGRIYNHIVMSLKNSMERGILNYLKMPVWKRTIDNWQIQMQCCGVFDYEDWYQLSWMDKYHIDVDSKHVEGVRLPTGPFHFPIVPWSCCRLKFPMQCLHDPLQQVQSAHLWKEQPKLVLESIYTEGCLKKLRNPIRWSITGFILVCVWLVIFQIAIIIVSRLLYTSSKNAIILRDPEGESPGYLLTRSCTGQGQRTVSELVLDIRSKSAKPKPKEAPYDADQMAKKSSSKNAGNKRSSKVIDLEKLSAKQFRGKIKEKTQKLTRQKRTDGHDSNEDPISTEDEEALMLR